MIQRLFCLALMAISLGACGTLTEITQVPFEVLSTTGDAASSASSGGDDEEAAAAARHYVRSDLDWIRRDAAAGGGEHLTVLALLLNDPRPATFGPWAQQHYELLFADLAEPEELIGRIRAAR